MVVARAKNALYIELAYMYPLTGDQVSKKLIHRYSKNSSVKVNTATSSIFSSVENVANYDQNFWSFPLQSGRSNHQKMDSLY